ncbi:MAG: hypothetical protein AB199_04195 [Parcubacteria bacterium C7867-004]|nr:MAG: hypothetical protein AB199_04195 [Parcubacteria bacterium C7867-004]
MIDFTYEGRDLEAMSFAQKYHEWILSLFRPFLGKRIAEVGAGSGSFTELLLNEGVEELVAVEPSKEMYPLLVRRMQGDARVMCRNGFFGDESVAYPEHFDSIVYVNVLEHVEDDAGELRHVYAALAPGGTVCIFVPALSWLYSEYDASIGHHRRYGKKQLSKLVRDAGFEVATLGYFDMVGVLAWLLIVKLLKKSPSAGSVGIYDNVIVPVERIIESMVRAPLGKNLFIVGRKPA